MFRNILVSVDGSPHAEQALAEAIDLADSCRARLTILTAVHRPPGWATTPMAAVACEQLAVGFEREASEILRAAVSRLPDTVPVTTILSHEPIREALMKRIDSGHHDLLVMGSRGRGAISASLLGSVSHYALNHSPIPVLIVHAEESKARSDPDRPASARQEPVAA